MEDLKSRLRFSMSPNQINFCWIKTGPEQLAKENKMAGDIAQIGGPCSKQILDKIP